MIPSDQNVFFSGLCLCLQLDITNIIIFSIIPNKCMSRVTLFNVNRKQEFGQFVHLAASFPRLVRYGSLYQAWRRR